MAQNDNLIKPPAAASDVFDPMEFWSKHWGKFALGAALVVAALAVFFWQRSNRDAEINEAEARFQQAKSFEDFHKLAADYPGTPAAAKALLLAADKDFNAGLYDEAIKSYRQYLADFPKNDNADAAAFGIGASLEAKGQYTDAIKAYDDVTKQYINALRGDLARLGMGRCHEELGDLQEARKIYEEILLAARASGAEQPPASYGEAQERLLIVKRKWRAANPTPPETGTTTSQKGTIESGSGTISLQNGGLMFKSAVTNGGGPVNLSTQTATPSGTATSPKAP